METAKRWTKEAIVDLIDNNDKAVARALLRIYAAQTSDEQATQGTRHTNGVGFNSVDAPTLTSIAQRCMQYGGTLTPKQTDLVRRRIRKYARQLADIANAS